MLQYACIIRVLSFAILRKYRFTVSDLGEDIGNPLVAQTLSWRIIDGAGLAGFITLQLIYLLYECASGRIWKSVAYYLVDEDLITLIK